MLAAETWSRRRLAAPFLFAAVAVAPLFPLAMASSYRFIDIDIDVYIGAADTILRRGDLYACTTDRGYYFTYPPFAALVLLPLGLLPTDVAHGVWSATILPLLALTVVVAAGPLAAQWARRWRVPRAVPRLGVFVILAWTLPVWINIRYGQTGVLLTAMVVVDCLWLRGKRSYGVLVGLAAAIKLTPGIFILHFLATRQWRAMWVSAGTFVGAQLLAFAVIPYDAWNFWSAAIFDNGRYGDNTIGNRSVRGMLARTELPASARSAIAIIVAVALLVVGVRRARKANEAGDFVAVVAILGALSMCLSPVAWQHHMTWLLIAAIALAGQPRRWWLATLLVGVLMVDLNEAGDAALDSWSWGSPLWHLVMDVHGLIAVAVVLALPVSARLTSRSETPVRTGAGY